MILYGVKFICKNSKIKNNHRSIVARLHKKSQCFVKEFSTYPKIVNSRFCGDTIQSSAVWITWQSIHDGKANGGGAIALQAEIIMSSSNRVTMLMNHQMMALGI